MTAGQCPQLTSPASSKQTGTHCSAAPHATQHDPHIPVYPNALLIHVFYLEYCSIYSLCHIFQTSHSGDKASIKDSTGMSLHPKRITEYQ